MNLFDLSDTDVAEFHKRRGSKQSDRQFFHTLLFPDFSNVTPAMPEPKALESSMDKELVATIKHLEEEVAKRDAELIKQKKKLKKVLED